MRVCSGSNTMRITMPARVNKVKGGYSVRTPNGVHAKRTTKAKATSQAKLINAIDHGFKPRKRKAK